MRSHAPNTTYSPFAPLRSQAFSTPALVVEPVETQPPRTQTVSRQSTSTTGNHPMFPFWLIFGIVTILMGIFNRQMLRFLGFKPMSEVLTSPNLKHSSRIIEKIGRWLVITLGVSFLVQGLGRVLSSDISYKISFSLLGLSGLMLLAIIGITIANCKAQ
jgi:hypothetical protein